VNVPASAGASGAALPALWDEAAETPEVERDQRRRLKIAGGLLLVLFLLGMFVPIGGAVIGTGQAGVESRVKRIAHPAGGVITEIAVRNGEHVEKGQLLMRLDDTVTGADATYSSLSVEQLLAQRARLEAERLGANTIRFPTELTSAGTPSARKAMADEAQLFAIRRSEQGQLRAQLESRTVQFNEQIRGYEAQIAALRQQRVLIGPELEGVRELWEKQLVTISRLNQLERTAADIDGNIASLQAQIAQARARITEAQEQAIQLAESRRAQAGTELAQVNTALNQTRTRSVSAADLRQRSEIRAPYSGTVEKLAFSAVGDVVRPAEPIMEIVPDKDMMVIEAAISPADIDQVRAGQDARVQFSAFNVAATPEVPGKVVYVATDRTENPEGDLAFYTVRIELDPAALEKEGLKLRSGMPAEVFIETGSRSLLSYALKPLRDQFARAFRDN
jgi:HlyD family type I secretion membrane fusion protein